MDQQQTIKMIGAISDANGISGFEDDTVATIKTYMEGLGECYTDSLLNLYLNRRENKGGRMKVQLDAHSDEVGFMVHAIRPDGMLQIIPIGGWVSSNIPAHRVRVRNGEGRYILGITASKPPHYMSEAERRQPLELEQITVDVGAVSRADAIDNFKIRIAEPVVPDVTFEYQQEHDLMIGKSFDCRLGCASVISTLQELAGEELKVDVIAAIAAQEEVGVRGATVTAGNIKPDIAIVFEGCPADDTCVPDYEIQTAIKRGPMLRHIDARMITNPRYQRYALGLCRELAIPVQEAVRKAGATNGAAIHLSGQGVPVIVIGIPVRYAHTHYGISAFADYQHGVTLACEILRRLDETVIKGF